MSATLTCFGKAPSAAIILMRCGDNTWHIDKPGLLSRSTVVALSTFAIDR